MVEVADEGRRGIPAGDQALRERVQKLSDELEELERGHDKVCGVFRMAVAALAGMGPCELGRASSAAVVSLRKAAAAEPLDPAALEQAVAGLRTALLLEPESKPGKGKDQGTADEGASDAAAHVALAIMEGLRLGEPEFDAHLDKAILQINRFIAEGKVRPAMAVLTDLLDHYRYQHSRRWAAAEAALKEVLDELLNTESEVMTAVTAAQTQLTAASQQYEEQVTRSMGAMVVDVSQSPDLETLKVKALEHIRGLRDHLRAHRSHEREVMEKSQGEISRLRENLSLTRQRMEQVERVSKVLSQEAMTDPLTKAWNKRALTARMEDDLANPAHWPISLIVFDIDHFKGVNDSFGHQAGDRALKAITQQAGQSLRAQDTLFRYAGDEFVILLRKTSLADAKQVAERVRQAAESIKFTYRGEAELKITVSLGAAEARQGESPEALFERADQALLGAKRAGRNRVGVG
jgi:diguanylate cyclase